MGAYVRAYLKRPAAAGVFLSMLLFLSAPADAHHPGGGGNTGSGGPINTISADTLSEGLIAASVRYEFIRLGQLSDADLIAAASKGTHAHSIRSIDAVSLSVAYGITNDLTVAVRAAGVRRSDIREPGEDMLSGGHMGMMNSSDMNSLMSPDGINQRGNSAGFGDVTILGQYRFYNNSQTGTSAAVLFGFMAPTGSSSQRDTFVQLFDAELEPCPCFWERLFVH